MIEINKTYQGDALEVLKTFPNNFIDCVVTSPPYFGLRDYEHLGQLGSEEHFQNFIDNLCNIFDEVKRILKPTGTCFINLGDTYNGNKTGNTNGTHGGSVINKQNYTTESFTKKVIAGIGNKCLLMIPERFAIEMINRGWILRNQIIWYKRNQMPSSATDRFTVDFEKIFFFVKQQKYYFEQQLEKSLWAEFDARSKIKGGVESNGKSQSGQYATNKVAYRQDGMRNMRTVWSINTEGIIDEHFAAYPERLPEAPIKAGCPPDGIVLDPFNGSGTTRIVAEKLGRNSIGIELNPKYIEIENRRRKKELGMFEKVAS